MLLDCAQCIIEIGDHVVMSDDYDLYKSTDNDCPSGQVGSLAQDCISCICAVFTAACWRDSAGQV